MRSGSKWLGMIAVAAAALTLGCKRRRELEEDGALEHATPHAARHER